MSSPIVPQTTQGTTGPSTGSGNPPELPSDRVGRVEFARGPHEPREPGRDSGGTIPHTPRGTTPAPELPSDQVLLGIGLFGVGGLALAVVHGLSGGAIGLPCPLRATTGLDCPGCGATRMAAALLDGDLGAALQYNAPVLAGGLVLGYLWIAWMLQRFGVVRLPRPRLGPRGKRWLLPVLVTLAVAFAVIRNLPWEPFSALYVP